MRYLLVLIGGALLGQAPPIVVSGPDADLSHSQHTINARIYVTSLPLTGCVPYEEAVLTSANPGSQYFLNSGSPGNCVWTAVGVGNAYSITATGSPQTILETTHLLGVNADVLCFSGPLTNSVATGNIVYCSFTRDSAGDVTVTWGGSSVQSIEVFSAGGVGPQGPPGPPGPASNVYVSTVPFNFTPQTPGGTIASGGGAKITLSPVPPGVNGLDANHYYYISNGVGAAESCLSTGGSAVAGATVGTLVLTCSNNHSGAWTISSSTAGAREAYLASPPGSVIIWPAGKLGVDCMVGDGKSSIWGQTAGGTLLVPLAGSCSYLFTYNGAPAVAGVDIGYFSIDLTGFGSISAVNVQNMGQGKIHDIQINAGVNGLVLSGPNANVASVVYTTVRDLFLTSQTAVGILVEGDNVETMNYEDIYIFCELSNAACSTTIGFEIYRTTSTYTGAHVLKSVGIQNMGQGFLFTSTILNEDDIWMSDFCFADGIGSGGYSGSALNIVNLEGINSVGNWYVAAGTGYGVAIDGAGSDAFTKDRIGSNGGAAVGYLHSPTEVNFIGDQYNGCATYCNFIPGGSNPTGIHITSPQGTFTLSNWANVATFIYATGTYYNLTSGQTEIVDAGCTFTETKDCHDFYDFANGVHGLISNDNGLLTVQSNGGVALFGVNVCPEAGGSANNAIVCNFGPPGLYTPGTTVSVGFPFTIVLMHTLQAGSNTININSSGAIALKSHLNPANNIGTAYAVGGTLTAVYNGTVFVDMSQ